MYGNGEIVGHSQRIQNLLKIRSVVFAVFAFGCDSALVSGGVVVSKEL